MRDKSTAVDRLGRRLSSATIAFHTAVAAQLGLSVTENKALAALAEAGSMSAGELARQLGLTTGAVTGLIDRLEQSRLVRRAADPQDRRRVVVVPVPNTRRARRVAALYGPMGKRIRALIARHSPAERDLLLAFVTQAATILEEETVMLRGTL